MKAHIGATIREEALCVFPRQPPTPAPAYEGVSIPTPVPRGKLASAQTRQRRLATAPKRGAGGAAPAGGTGGVPLFPKTLEGGAGGIAAHAKPTPPLMEGARQAATPVPQAGCRGRSPRRGYSVSPCFQ